MSEVNSKLIDEIYLDFSIDALEVKEIEKIGVTKKCNVVWMPPFYPYKICKSYDVYSGLLNGEEIKITCIKNSLKGCSFSPKNDS